MEKEANRTALNIEEAALLPAMPPRAMTGGAALRGVRQEENRMREMTVGEEKAWNGRGGTAGKRKEAQVNRAALKHVMRKR